MSFWDSVVADDAVYAFASDDFGAESVTYKPKGGGDRAFKAQVFREMPSLVAGTSIPAPLLRVFVPYNSDSTKGVTTVSVDADKISVATRYGETPTDHPIVAIESQDSGGWMLRLR